MAAAAVFTLTEWAHFTSAELFIARRRVSRSSATVVVLILVPDFFMRFVLWMLTHTVYRIKIVGRPNIPMRGPALIIANHVSMIDGALIGACVQRFVRFLVYGPYFMRRPVLGCLLRQLHAIPVTAGNKQEVVDAIDRARAELAAGHVVCIFAEGAISRTGNLLPFRRGFERIVKGLDVPDDSGVPGSRLGQHLQLQAGAILLETAGAAARTRLRSTFGEPMPASIDGGE